MGTSAPGEIQSLYYGNVWAASPSASSTPARSPPGARHARPSHHARREGVRDRTRRSVTRSWRSRRRSDIVIVGGGERMLNVPTAASTEYFAYGSDANSEQPAGLTFPGVFALIARRTWTSTARPRSRWPRRREEPSHGALNPKAQFRKEITLETVIKSPYVADPLKLSTAARSPTAGAAIVLASEESRDAPRAVWVLGTPPPRTRCSCATSGISCVTATEHAAKGAYRQAGKTPGDVKVVELHDCFTIAEIVATEGLGLIEPGAGGVAAEKRMDEPRGQDPGQPLRRTQGQGASHRGDRRRPDRRDRHWLRGEAGPRQVDGAARAWSHPRRQHRDGAGEPVRP